MKLSAPFTYDEVGATARDLPPGYDHYRESAVIGSGRERFEAAAEAVMHWAMQRGTGLGLTADTPRAEIGATVVVGRGPLKAPCRVVYVVEESDRRGFAYGTLPGHPESGEELFTVRFDPGSQEVRAEVIAFSRPGTWWSKSAAPLTRVFARMMIRRYLRAV